jgi:hypothetical protein
MAINYNMYGSPQIYGAPQVQAGRDRRYQRAYEAQRAANKNAMDLLLMSYNNNIEKNRSVQVSRDDSMSNDIYDAFYADTANTKITRRATTGNDLLLGAKTAEELLQIAGVIKPVGKPTAAYMTQLNAAKELISKATEANRLGGNTNFDFSSTSTPATEYSFDKYSLGISEALSKKYAALGNLQRGALENETISTSDDESVVFSMNSSSQIENEFSQMQKNFKSMTESFNKDFTTYGQQQKKIGTYQTATLSEDQMYRKILSDIESSYTSFNSRKDKGYVAGMYMNPRIADRKIPSATEYLASLPTTITP